jgi:hypothetical protein
MTILMASVAFPRFNASVRGTRLEEAGALLGDHILEARKTAVRQECQVKMQFAAKGTSYWFLLQDRAAAPLERWMEFGDSFWDTPSELPTGVRTTYLTTTYGREAARELVFPAGGVMEPVVLTLANEGGEKMEVSLGAWVDEVAVRKGEDS